MAYAAQDAQMAAQGRSSLVPWLQRDPYLWWARQWEGRNRDFAVHSLNRSRYEVQLA